MAMEVVCGNCQGRLLVEQTGVVVACPHCNAHLQIGDPAPAPVPPPVWTPPAAPLAPAPVVTAPPPPPQLAPPPISFEPPVISPPPAVPEPPSLFPEINLNPPTPVAVPQVESLPAVVELPPPAVSATESAPAVSAVSIGLPPEMAEPDTWMPQISLTLPPPTPAAPPLTPPEPIPVASSDASTIMMPPGESFERLSGTANWQPVTNEPSHAGETDIWRPSPSDGLPAAEPTSASSVPAQPDPAPLPRFDDFIATTAPANPSAAAPDVTAELPYSASAQPVAEPPKNSGPTIVTSDELRVAVVPRYLFVLVASYASAITLAFLYLWWTGGGSTLDLPDLVPMVNKKTGQIGLQLAPETPLPKPYRLKLGESKRYGNLMVTPVKVTKGPLEFTHFLADGQSKPPTQAPVLKLWMKFENVSSDQTFAALDDQLLFRRVGDKENITQDKSNNYVCQQTERKRIGKRVPVYTLPPNGEWLLKDQNLNTELKPQDEWQTYIPSNDEDLSSLEGPLTWRLHFRKGYNPQSHRGVTTLVEVEFDSKDIVSDS